jgi:hypothetical protein
MARSRFSGALATSESLSRSSITCTRTTTLKATYRKGYSQHGDYVFGWKDDSLQRAMNSRCNGDTCKELKTQTADESMKCTKTQVVKDDINGCKLHSLIVLGSSYVLT